MSQGISRDYEIINQLGLHARAAAKLVGISSKFKCDIYIQKGQAQVSGKSILGVMTLAASKGTTVTVTCKGDDEAAALDAIGDLIADRFGEEA